MARPPADSLPAGLLQGTLDMLVLKALRLGPMHGWGIAQRIETGSLQVLAMNEGSLYPALYRLERKGLLKADWGVSELNRRVKLYRLTALGRKQLASERSRWQQLMEAMSGILNSSHEESKA